LPQHIASLARAFGCVAVLGAALAGCSTNSPVAPASGDTASSVRRNETLARGFGNAPAARVTSAGWISPDAKKKKTKPLIYWANFGSNAVYIYSAKGTNPPEKGEITTGISNPERLFVDASLDVYATNLGNNTVTGYKPGATSPFLTISDGVDTPTGLTVDAAGTVYCANVGDSTVTEYPKGKTSPSLTISITGSPEYLAVDAKDNLYVSTGTGVIEFAPGSTQGKDLDLDMGSPSAIELDKSGNIIAIDASANSIDVFPAGQTQPSKVVPVTAGTAFALSLDKKENAVYASVEESAGFIVQQLDYPGGTSLSDKIASGPGDWPIAVSPDAVL
jgi:hypothetical protein